MADSRELPGLFSFNLPPSQEHLHLQFAPCPLVPGKIKRPRLRTFPFTYVHDVLQGLDTLSRQEGYDVKELQRLETKDLVVRLHELTGIDYHKSFDAWIEYLKGVDAHAWKHLDVEEYDKIEEEFERGWLVLPTFYVENDPLKTIVGPNHGDECLFEDGQWAEAYADLKTTSSLFDDVAGESPSEPRLFSVGETSAGVRDTIQSTTTASKNCDQVVPTAHGCQIP